MYSSQAKGFISEAGSFSGLLHLLVQPEETPAPIFQNARLKLALHRAQITGLIVELKYPSQIAAVCTPGERQLSHAAVTTNSTMYGSQQSTKAPMMTPSCRAALVSCRRLATVRLDDGLLSTPRVAPHRVLKLEVLVEGASSCWGT